MAAAEGAAPYERMDEDRELDQACAMVDENAYVCLPYADLRTTRTTR